MKRLKKRHLVIGAMVVGVLLLPIALYYAIYFGWLTAVPNTDANFCRLMCNLHVGIALLIIVGEITGIWWLTNRPSVVIADRNQTSPTEP